MKGTIVLFWLWVPNYGPKMKEVWRKCLRLQVHKIQQSQNEGKRGKKKKPKANEDGSPLPSPSHADFLLHPLSSPLGHTTTIFLFQPDVFPICFSGLLSFLIQIFLFRFTSLSLLFFLHLSMPFQGFPHILSNSFCFWFYSDKDYFKRISSETLRQFQVRLFVYF